MHTLLYIHMHTLMHINTHTYTCLPLIEDIVQFYVVSRIISSELGMHSCLQICVGRKTFNWGQILCILFLHQFQATKKNLCEGCAMLQSMDGK